MPPDSPLRVAVTIPYYRDPLLLRAALDSLLTQTDTDWRAVVVDDASPGDDAAAVVAAIADARIEFRRNDTTLGVAGNFERCFQLAEHSLHADVAVILHADDLLEPRFVERIRAEHTRRPDVAAVATNVTVVDEHDRPHQPLGDRVKRAMWPRGGGPHDLTGEDGLARTLTGLFWYCPAMSYRLSQLPALRWDGRWQQVMDLDLYGRMLLDGATIALLDEPLYRYRRHGGTTTAANTATLVRTREERAVLDELTAAATARGWRRARRAGRWRLTHRANALLVAAGCLARRDLALARAAAGLAVARA